MPAVTLSATHFAALQAENDALRGQVSGFSSEVKHLSALVEKLTFQLAMLRRMQFGQKSEASARMGDLFGTPIAIGQPAAPTAPPHKTSREPKAAPRVTLPPDLPVETTEIDLPSEQKCDAQGNPLRRIGEEVSDRLAVEPGRFYIKRTVRPKYADPALPENGVRCAPLPARIIERGLLDESALADIAIRKFDDHLPLHRISEIYYRDGGIDLAKQTLSDAMLACASWLAPLHAAVLAALKADRVLHVDETVLPLWALGKTIKARAWAYVGTTIKLTYYDFTVTKAGHHVRERLAGWGSPESPVYLQADAASNYDGLYTQSPHIREVGCWAHARRKFFEIAKHGNTPTASGALERINALFDIERKASEAGLDHDARRRWRAEHAKPKLDELAEFLKTEQQQLLPNTPTMAAIGYVQNHWQAFTRYLDHGQCVIDNNAAERALRVVAVGRKNWLFAGSERGGHAAGVFYTLIESAKANGHNPRVYLQDVLTRLPTTLDKHLDTLLPHRWAPLVNTDDISPQPAARG
ncbi:MAG: IS66 family transposase [Xanthomonadaceae bacterium]|nr:IS66 family transposase [Xanthomonadaceae bacterium]